MHNTPPKFELVISVVITLIFKGNRGGQSLDLIGSVFLKLIVLNSISTLDTEANYLLIVGLIKVFSPNFSLVRDRNYVTRFSVDFEL